MDRHTAAYWTELEGGKSLAQRASEMHVQALDDALCLLPCRPGHIWLFLALCNTTTNLGRLLDSIFGRDEVEKCHSKGLRKISAS